MNIEEKGLVVSNEKQFSYRTVEGNLGLRVSATGIPEAVGDKAVLRAMDHDYGLEPQDVEDYVQLLEEHNDHIPADEKEACLDRRWRPARWTWPCGGTRGITPRRRTR